MEKDQSNKAQGQLTEFDQDDDRLTPRKTVESLSKFIIGQNEAKKAVAIALRNRSRRRKLPEDLKEEIAPKNIIMIGPTGVGKTEIARRLSKLAGAPFIKVEATKYTEVGYVGRDVESMIRDLVNLAITMVKKKKRQELTEKARERVEERILDILLPSTAEQDEKSNKNILENHADVDERQARAQESRAKMRERLQSGELDDRQIEYQIKGSSEMPSLQIMGNTGMDELDNTLQNFLGDLMPKSKKKKQGSIEKAREDFLEEELEGLMDMDQISSEAIQLTEEMGIVFIDEIDKVTGPNRGQGPEVSREGVQRDILPIVEGSTINTKYGSVRTDHILFIASGAFHESKPSDLIPELQGRFPIRVELKNLTEQDFQKILTTPENSLIKQYSALMDTEQVELRFAQEAISELSRIAFQINEEHENIGARRLHTIIEKLLEEVSFEAPDLPENERIINIDAQYVRDRLQEVVQDQDLTRYIL